MSKEKKQKIDYKLWLVVALGLILFGVIGAVVAFLGYVLIDRHNKKKGEKE